MSNSLKLMTNLIGLTIVKPYKSFPFGAVSYISEQYIISNTGRIVLNIQNEELKELSEVYTRKVHSEGSQDFEQIFELVKESTNIQRKKCEQLILENSITGETPLQLAKNTIKKANKEGILLSDLASFQFEDFFKSPTNKRAA